MKDPRSATNPGPELSRPERIVAAASGGLAAMLALAGFLGQLIASPLFLLESGQPWINPSVALSIVALATALLLWIWPATRQRAGFNAMVGAGLGLVGLVNAVILLAHTALPQLRESASLLAMTSGAARVAGFPADKASPVVAGMLVLIAVTLAGLWHESERRHRWRGISLAFSLATMGFSLVCNLGSEVDEKLFHTEVPHGTAIILALLSMGIAVACGLRTTVGACFGEHPDRPTITLPAPLRRTQTQLFWAGLSLFALLAAGSYFYLQGNIRAAEHDLETRLDSVAILKVTQVENWRRERLGDATALSRIPELATRLVHLTAAPDDGAARDALAGYLNSFRQTYHYRSLVLYNAGLQPIAASPPGSERTAEASAALLAEARNSPAPLIQDLARQSNQDIYLDIVIAIPAADGGFGGAALLRIDARTDLFPLLGIWPGSSPSSETMLIRRDGDAVLYLNDLRFRPDAALNFRLPLTQPGLVGAKAVLTDRLGLTKGVDYRNQPIVGVARRITGTPWTLLTKLDLAEASAPIRTEVIRLGAALGSALLVFGLTFGRLWHRRQLELDEEQRRAEREKLLADARLHVVMQQTNDVILLIDEHRTIRDANDRVRVLYGWTAQEMRGKPEGELCDPGEAESLTNDFSSVLRAPDGLVFERTHRRRDGTTFRAEVSARVVQLEGRPHVIAGIRDITERIAQNLEIERLGRMYATISAVNQSLVRAKDRDELFRMVCRALVECRLFKLAWVGWLDPATQLLRPVASAGDTQGFLDGIVVSADPGRPEGQGPGGRAFRGEHAYVCNDFLHDPVTAPWHARAASNGIRASISLPLRQSGRNQGLIIAYAGETNAFHPQAVALLEEAAGDISYGLDTFEVRAQHEAAEQALRASETRLKFLLTATPAVIFSMRAGGDYATTFISSNVRDILGHEPTAFSESPGFWRNGVHPDDLPGAEAIVAAALLRDGGADRVEREYRFRHRDGSWRWMREGLRINRDEQGRPREFVGFWSDVTELRRAEASIRSNEERLRLALEATHLGIYDLDVATGRVAVNAEYARMLGYEPEGFTESTDSWAGRLHPEDRKQALACFDDCLNGRRPEYRVEFRMRTRSGEWRWIFSFGRLVARAPDGRPRRMLGTHADITERKTLEGHLRKLSRTIEQAPLGVIITDLTGAIEYANPKFCAMTGYAVDEVIGRNPRFLKSGETPPEAYRRLWATILRGDVWASETRNRRKDGELYNEFNIIAPLIGESGRPTHFVSFKDDITDRLRQKAESANMLAKERELSEMKTRFISVTSHEFRTPMAAALGSIELLLNHADRLPPGKASDLLGRADDSLRRMAEMLDDVLTLNRMDARRVEVRFMTLDLARLVGDAIEEVRLADRGTHRLELRLTGTARPFTTDPNLLRHVLTNLFSNAVRYSPAGTSVTAELAFGAGGVTLAVEDRGIGIPAADHERLFQPFERGSNVGNIKGTGLGLSIVRRMTTLLGGKVSFSSPPQGGTRFVIELPDHPAPAVDP